MTEADKAWDCADEWKKKCEAAEERAERAEKVRDEWKDKAMRLLRGDFAQICSYCGWETQKGGGSWDDLQEHVKKCPEHPLGKSLSELTALRAREAELKHDIAELTACIRENEDKIDAAKSTVAREAKLREALRQIGYGDPPDIFTLIRTARAALEEVTP